MPQNEKGSRLSRFFILCAKYKRFIPVCKQISNFARVGKKNRRN